jgi:Uma2 family endonuclease
MALPQAINRRFTYADYLHWPGDACWELIDGEAYAKPPAENPLHQIVIGQLINQINCPPRNSLTRVDVILPAPNEADEQSPTVVQPDILVVCDPAKITERALYERAGVREYWLANVHQQFFQKL